jgi:hypothetical protein
VDWVQRTDLIAARATADWIRAVLTILIAMQKALREARSLHRARLS